MTVYELDTEKSVEYAKTWAFGRNPDFHTFDLLGGDCTNFVSQCIYAGGAVMNYTPDTGWYYLSAFDRAAAWTGVEYFYRFMVNNTGAGPFGKETALRNASAGDVIQLCMEDGCYHSLFVVDIRDGVPYVAAHTNDAFDRPLYSYGYDEARCIHIIGARKNSRPV
ncbi:MAG: amidase domain-containing protein [Ruminiclostridium sp.]|nr:amidase domain-containing protein [Ruminiclostridium sp.]